MYGSIAAEPTIVSECGVHHIGMNDTSQRQNGRRMGMSSAWSSPV